MSSYIEFFLVNKDTDKFHRIASYSRSHIIYRTLSGRIPYEIAVPFEEKDFHIAIENLKEELAYEKRQKKNLKADLKANIQMTSSEAYDFFSEKRRELEDTKQEIECIKAALHDINFIIDIMELGNTIYYGIDVELPGES
jgi:hypothetical protein